VARHREHAYAEFDQMGHPAVRVAYNLHRLKGLDYEWAGSWLALREAEASDASQAEQMDFSRRAADAAEVAATAARLANKHAKTANKIATAALAAAVIAIGISIYGALHASGH
jgi:hypothetical protein